MGRHSAGRWEPPGPTRPLEAKVRELALLGELCQWIVRLGPGIGLGFRDAIPRVELTSPGGVVVDVRVDDDGQVFVFRPSYERHPTDDVRAAAEALVTLVRSCDQAPQSVNGAPG